MSTQLLPIVALQIRTRTSPLLIYGTALIAVAAAYIGMHLVRPAPVFPLDDPYITLHSAQVLHWGFDPNYAGVSPLYGATSAPFLSLVYLLLFVLSPLLALDAACWLGVLFYVFGLVRLARQFGLGRRDGLLLVTLGLTASFVPFHLLNGLETSWAMACVVWTLAFASGDVRNRPWAAVLSGITASVRPDLIPFSGLVVIALAYQQYRTHGARGARAWRTAGVLLLALLPIIPWAVWYYHATGFPFPLTGITKRYFLGEDRLGWKAKLGLEGLPLGFFIVTCGPLVLAPFRVARNILGLAVLLFFTLFFAAIYVQFPSALIWNWCRYPVVLVPMMVWGIAAAIGNDKAQGWRSATRLLHICVTYSVLLLPFYLRTYLRECEYFDRNLHDVAKWCQQNIPSNATLLVHDAGYIAYATNFHIVDFVGLKTPEAIVAQRQYTWPSAGDDRAEALAHIALDSKAEYLIVIQIWPAVASLPDELRELGWRVDPLRTDEGYYVFHLTPPKV